MKEGIVFRSTGSWYQVLVEGSLLDCRMKGKLRLKGVRSTNPIAVGDKVMVEEETESITEILPRKNYIIRKSSNLSKESHIIAANIDQAFLVITMAKPQTSTGFIDRFLVTAEAYHIPVTLLFNKIDVYTDSEKEKMDELIAGYTAIGYACEQIVALDTASVEPIKALMKEKVTMVSGHSGVGKSTFINTIDSNLDIPTGEISESHYKGKHTTTFAEMHPLEFGGYIIDTPGIKGFGLVYLEKDVLSHRFPEMRAHMDDCKFNNCFHIKEPSCAVKEAVKNGSISAWRYDNYLTMYNEDEEEKYR